jgi:hypothetical protein
MYLVLLFGGRSAAIVVGPAVVVISDAVLTFAVPALVFTTRSVRSALRVGIEVLRASWPWSRGYVIAPGLALAALGPAGHALPIADRLILLPLTTLLPLCLRGAVTRYYLRLIPVGDNIAAFRDGAPAGVIDEEELDRLWNDRMRAAEPPVPHEDIGPE